MKNLTRAADYQGMPTSMLQRAEDHGALRERLLCVDDDPQVLEGLRDVLWRDYDVRTAGGGEKALEILRGDPVGFKVVISDMRMPGMDGSAFLARARRVAPDAIRMLLTGQADTDAAIAAINEGQVFRFLTKPCRTDDLMRACAAAVAEHRLLTLNRVLLDRTLEGTLTALSEALSLLDPAAFAAVSRRRRLAAELTEAVHLLNPWEVETAVILAEIGWLTVARETATRLAGGDPQPTDPGPEAARVGAIAWRVIRDIPRLEGVRTILANHGRRYDGRDVADATEATRPPLGACVLKVITDFDSLVAAGATPQGALATMRTEDGGYDPRVLTALADSIRSGLAHVARDQAAVRT